MPGSDGIEATRRIREIEAGGPRTPIVALTANAFDEDRDACRAAGMDGFLTKPLDYNALFALLTVMAEDQRASRVRSTLNDRLDRQRGGGLVGQSRVMRAFAIVKPMLHMPVPIRFMPRRPGMRKSM